MVFKSPEVSDAKMLVNSIIKIAGSTDNLLSAPEDFDKYLKDKVHINAIYLPSTSPANAKMSVDDLINNYHQALR